MAYTKTTWNEGAAPGISAANLNHLETQYDEVKTELQKADGTSNIQPHGSNLVNASVTDTKLGNRTVDQAIADAYANTGTLTQLLSWIVKTILAMKGSVTNWYDAAAASISTIWAKFDPATGHKHTGAAGDGPKIPISSLQDLWVIPGDSVIYFERLAEDFTGTAITLSITISRPGRYRITGEAKVSSSSYSTTIYFKTTRHNSGTTSGHAGESLATYFSTTSTSYVTFSVDMGVFVGLGNEIQIRLSQSSSGISYLRNLRLKGSPSSTVEAAYISAIVQF